MISPWLHEFENSRQGGLKTIKQNHKTNCIDASKVDKATVLQYFMYMYSSVLQHCNSTLCDIGQIFIKQDVTD